MELIKRKRNLEYYTVRSIPKSLITYDEDGCIISADTSSDKYYYGTIPDYKIDSNGDFILDSNGNKIPNTIDIDLFLKQDYDDMGLFTDKPYTPSTLTLTQKPSGFNSFIYGRLAGAPLSFYTTPPVTATGQTDDSFLKQVYSLRIDSNNQPIYVPLLNINRGEENTFNGVITDNSDFTIYKIGSAKSNVTNTGVEFKTYKNEFVESTDVDGNPLSWKKTEFTSKNGGWNNSNLTLSALTKQEEYLGIVFKPEINSDVFINRGVEDIFERHAILSEIKTTNDIDNFRGGYLRT
jgi:hypothetical protein